MKEENRKVYLKWRVRIGLILVALGIYFMMYLMFFRQY